MGLYFLTIKYMRIETICTIIGTIISLGIILYKIGRLSSKIDSNTHRLDNHDKMLDKMDRFYKDSSLETVFFL